MRTTVTIPDEILKKTMVLSGQLRQSSAIVWALQDYIAMRNRMAFLEKLHTTKLPHNFKKIKKLRKKGSWSS